MNIFCEYCGGTGEVGMMYDSVMCNECKGKGYIEANEDRMYIVAFYDRTMLFRVEKNINRANNPNDWELIKNYIQYHFGKKAESASIYNVTDIVELNAMHELYEV